LLQAFAWGFLAAASLLAGAALAVIRPVGRRTLGLVMAFGSGALISAVAYELVAEAFVMSKSRGALAAELFMGAVVYWAGDVFLDRVAERSGAADDEGSSGAAILLGVVLDGIPESLVIGLTLLGGQVSAALVVGVFLSNFPEALGSTAGMRAAGASAAKIWTLWTVVVVASGVAAAVGFVALDSASSGLVAFVLSFAAGGDPEDARRHDDARCVRGRRPADRPGDRGRVRVGVRGDGARTPRLR
jgi:ZIP family zinc transporter